MSEDELRAALLRFAIQPYWDGDLFDRTGRGWTITSAEYGEARDRGFIEEGLPAAHAHEYRFGLTEAGINFIKEDTT